MTENEALYILNNYKFDMRQNGAFDMITTISVVTNALKELQHYREIGTVEECREAVEKQRTKKIIIRDWNPTKCPTCGHELSTSLGDGYYKHPIFLERCPECGQAIQWDNLEGMEDE